MSNEDRSSLEAQLLGDMGYEPPKPKSRYQELTDEQIATLQQQRAAQGQPPYTAEEIAELKAEFIERQRLAAQEQALAQQAAAAAAQSSILLEETTYQAPEKKKSAAEVLPQVDASALLEEPAPEPVRRVVFNQEDLEAAKKSAAKRAAESLSEAPKSDPAESRRQMEELRRQQQADLATAGFPVSIVLTIIGVIAGACMALFASRPYPDGDAPNGFFGLMGTVYIILGIAVAILSVTIVLRVQSLKGFASFVFGASSLLMLIPGIIILLYKRGTELFGMTVAAFVLAIVGCLVVTFVMSTSDKLGAYYGKKEIMYD